MLRPWGSRFVLVSALLAAHAGAAAAQPPVARPVAPPAAPGAAAASKPAPAAPAKPAAAEAEAPPPASALGVPLFPSAQFLTSYDAGRNQRFYLYGCTQSFAELVAYYRTVLKDKGELIFDAPAMHQFDVGKFKETDVAFMPGVTIKDYTWGGSPGYLNPVPGASPASYPTVIQIVSPPGGIGGRPK